MASARHSCCHLRNRSIASHGVFASWLVLLACPGRHAVAADFCVSSPTGWQNRGAVEGVGNLLSDGFE